MTLSLPLRLNLINLGFITAIALTLVTVGGGMLYKQEKLNANTRAMFAANELAKRAERLLNLQMQLKEFQGFEEQCLEIIKGDSLLEAAALFDVAGIPLYQSNDQNFSQLKDTILHGFNTVTTIQNPPYWFVIHPVRLSIDKIEGYAVVKIDYKRFISEVIKPIALLALISMLFSLISVAIQQVLFRVNIGRPLVNLVRTADTINSVDPDRVTMLKQLSSDDDIGHIYGALFRLMNRLHETKNKLVEQNRELDNIVKTRTEQLECTNKQLAEDIEHRKKLEQELTIMAGTDYLTGLPNRASLDIRLKKILEKATVERLKVAVLFIDLDYFKTINDTLGHQTGDKLLIEVSHRLVSIVRRSDTVARLGGDEFLIILPGVNSAQDVNIVANKIITSLEKPFSVDGNNLYVGSSIGISISPDDSTDAQVLMKNADTAMYNAKNCGRNNFQFFNTTMLQTVQKRLTIETQLRSALENNEFELHYQPIFQTDTIQMVGLEALLRWRTSDGTLIPPDKFIGIAEDIGLIIPIGAWVLQEACRQMVKWDKENINAGKISVNLSARQLSDPELLNMVTDTLNHTMLSPTRLVFEITESTLMRKPDEAVKVLNKFKEMGIKLAIDDFGTGYSSFAYLKHLSVHQLKIDRSFISNITDDSSDAKITATIITLAHGLELGVVAEGVETKKQLEILQQYSCDEVQGYLFSRPLNAEGITRFMSQSIQL